MDRSRLETFVSQRVGALPLAEPVILSPTDTIRQAVDLMQTGSRSCVLVQDAGRLSGIFTERDVLSRCMVDGFDWDGLLAGVLTPDPRTITTETPVAEAIAIMQRHDYRTLPVVEGDRVVGLARLGDLIRHFAEAFPEEILNLPPRPHQVATHREGG